MLFHRIRCTSLRRGCLLLRTILRVFGLKIRNFSFTVQSFTNLANLFLVHFHAFNQMAVVFDQLPHGSDRIQVGGRVRSEQLSFVT